MVTNFREVATNLEVTWDEKEKEHTGWYSFIGNILVLKLDSEWVSGIRETYFIIRSHNLYTNKYAFQLLKSNKQRKNATLNVSIYVLFSIML